jgi:prepilin peptidase CpaA
VIWDYVSMGVLAGVLIAAAISDLRQGKVFNWLTYPAILVGLALGAAQGAATGQMREVVVSHVLGFGFGFGVLFIAYLLGGMGGGDVKLMAAVGALVGWPKALDAVFYSFLAAAAIGVIVMIWRGEVRTVLRRLWLAVRILPLPTARMEEAVPTSTRLVPFGFAACLGTLWFLVEDRTGVSLWDVVSGGLGWLARLVHLWK